MEPVKIDLKKLIKDFFDPFKAIQIWINQIDCITRKDIAESIKYGYTQHPDTPVKMDDVFGFWDESDHQTHINRIAWLAENFTHDHPIDIEFGIPQWGVSFGIQNGNHRLFAAVYRNEPYIMANCSGICDLIEEYTYKSE